MAHFVLLKKKGDLSYLVQMPKKIESIHSRRLIPYFKRNLLQAEIPPPIPTTDYTENIENPNQMGDNYA